MSALRIWYGEVGYVVRRGPYHVLAVCTSLASARAAVRLLGGAQ